MNNNEKSKWQSDNEKTTISPNSELLRCVEISGPADFKINGIYKTLEFSLAISGSGDVKYRRTSEKVIKSVAGSGEVHKATQVK